VGYRWEQHIRPDARAKRTGGVHLQNFLDEPASDTMSNKEHASRRIVVICDEEFIKEVEVRLDLGTKCHVRRLGPGITLRLVTAAVAVAEWDVG
jgi:hypothetical protein